MYICLKIQNSIPHCLEVIDNDKIHQFPFQEVDRKQIASLRLSKKPGLIYKDDNKFYYTSIPGTLRLASGEANLGLHLCGRECSKVCRGCQRTADLTVDFQKRCGKNFFEAVRASWRIEKYPFVLRGFEAFNMEEANDSFIVLACTEYAHCAPRKPNPIIPGSKAYFL